MGNALPAANRVRLHLRNLACSLGRMPREDCREAKRQGQEDEAVREREREVPQLSHFLKRGS